jgi:hypothetical protein
MRRSLFAIPLIPLAFAVLAPGCHESTGCFGGDDGYCLPPSPCRDLAFTCSDPELFIRMVDDAGDRPPGLNALAARGDVIIGNDRMLAVVDAPGSPHHLATSGGALLDLVARDGDELSADDLNQMLQTVGILPDDQARYRELNLIDHSPDFVAVVARGKLDGRPDVDIVTRYEVRPCEPGVRVRTEIYHGGRDPLATLLADAFWWGGREVTPFVPLTGQGFTYPDLDLLELGDSIFDVPFMGAQGHSDATSAYGVVRCDAASGEAFQSTTVSALGHERTIVLPGDALAYERFVAVGKGPGLSRAANHCYEAREHMFGERNVVVTGRLVDDEGLPVGGDERRAALLFFEPGDPRTPRNQAVPDADGEFLVRLPANRAYRARLRVLGRALPEEMAFDVAEERVALEPMVVPDVGAVEVTVTDSDGNPVMADVVLTPVDAARGSDFRGSLHGQFDEARCSPFLGPPHGASPACNRVLVDGSGTARFIAPEGAFYVYASRGPFATLAREAVDLLAGETARVSLTVDRIDELLPVGWVSADFHVHAGASFDSSLPERDRALSFVASGVDVIAATDHDVVTTYEEASSALGIADRVVVMPGVETTGQVLFDLRDDADFPQVIGHYNFWPLFADPLAPRNGAPDDERLEPGALFDRIAPLYDGEGVAQLNHPFAETAFGRDEGFLTAIEYDPRKPIATSDEAGAKLLSRPAGEHRNIDHDVQEVMNGASTRSFLKYRAGWFAFLNQGFLRGGTANSDSHTLAVEVLGYPRTLVRGGHSVSDFDRERFNDDVRHGRMTGTNGPILIVCIDAADGTCAQPSLDHFEPAPNAELHIELRGAPWIPVEEIRIIINGKLVRVIEEGIGTLADPFTAKGVQLFVGSIPLAELTDGLDGDAWLVVEAGFPLVLAADLDDDDGIVDTTDNNGDGRVDDADQEGLDEDHYFREPEPPEADDPRFHLHVIAPGTWPTAFTNPLVLDRDGDGSWTSPGL